MEVLNGYRLPQPEGCPDAAYLIMQSCWDKDPHSRPRFQKISEMILLLLNAREADDPRPRKVLRQDEVLPVMESARSSLLARSARNTPNPPPRLVSSLDTVLETPDMPAPASEARRYTFSSLLPLRSTTSDSSTDVDLVAAGVFVCVCE